MPVALSVLAIAVAATALDSVGLGTGIARIMVQRDDQNRGWDIRPKTLMPASEVLTPNDPAGHQTPETPCPSRPQRFRANYPQ